MSPQPEVTIREVYDLLKEMRQEISENYVTKNEFIPVKIIVYGLVGTILTTVLGVLLSHAVQAS